MLYKIKDIFAENKDEHFQKQAFAHNNVFAFSISSFLVVQQLYYGLIVNSISSTIGKAGIIYGFMHLDF